MTINKNVFVLTLLASTLSIMPNVCGAVANIGTWSFLQGTPAEAFNRQDWSIFGDSIDNTLENAADGSTTAWENPKTKSSGEIEILRTVRNSAHFCRLVRITNQAKNSSNVMDLIFCKQPNGEWKIANPSTRR